MNEDINQTRICKSTKPKNYIPIGLIFWILYMFSPQVVICSENVHLWIFKSSPSRCGARRGFFSAKNVNLWILRARRPGAVPAGAFFRGFLTAGHSRASDTDRSGAPGGGQQGPRVPAAHRRSLAEGGGGGHS